MPRFTPQQLSFSFSSVRNSELLAVHWLQHRLPLEPEWHLDRAAVERLASGLLHIWEIQKGRVERYGNEASLEQALIQPVFQLLGWHLKYQTYLQGREPDYALFASSQALDAALVEGHASHDFWRHATLVADAKAWHVSLDRPIRRGSRREYPPEQIEWYLDRSKVDFAILTNGKLWRLIPRELGVNSLPTVPPFSRPIATLVEARVWAYPRSA